MYDVTHIPVTKIKKYIIRYKRTKYTLSNIFPFSGVLNRILPKYRYRRQTVQEVGHDDGVYQIGKKTGKNCKCAISSRGQNT